MLQALPDRLAAEAGGKAHAGMMPPPMQGVRASSHTQSHNATSKHILIDGVSLSVLACELSFIEASLFCNNSFLIVPQGLPRPIVWTEGC